MNKGYFFVLEGGEGSGKTTTSHIIKKKLEQEHNIECVITREPGGYEVAEEIRNLIFDNNISAKTEALLFAAARKEHLDNIILPALEEKKIVICDRYIVSSVVYQGYARNLGTEEVFNLNKWATDSTFPDLTFFYDISPKEAISRIMTDDDRELNRFDLEGMEFHNKLYAGYKKVLSDNESCVNIDARESIEDVANSVVNKIVEFING